MEFLRKFNGTKIEPYERKDFELYYLKITFETYLKEILQVADEKDRVVASLEDEGLMKYVEEHHPRFFELVGLYGSPIDLVNLKSEGKNISQTSAQIELESFLEGSKGKVLKKKLLLSMTVNALKAMCSKLFKANMLEIHLEYRGPEDT
mmetsp:Transcript_13288/g.22550  ORF Transcript_13288/g.22550 Transcript_13288/m.22550 type:complete len:149 (+) Transcript_13288:1336-1782(+)